MAVAEPAGAVRLKLGSVSQILDSGVGYLIGLDDAGHRLEALGTWAEVTSLQDARDRGEAVYLHLEPWQLLSVDGAIRPPPTLDALRERAAFIRGSMLSRVAEADREYP